MYEDDLGWNHYLGINEDSYESIQDLLFNDDNFDENSMYYCRDLYNWVEMLKIRDTDISTEDCLEVAENIINELHKYLLIARRSGKRVSGLNDLFIYMMENYPIDIKYIKSRINYLDSLVR